MSRTWHRHRETDWRNDRGGDDDELVIPPSAIDVTPRSSSTALVPAWGPPPAKVRRPRAPRGLAARTKAAAKKAKPQLATWDGAHAKAIATYGGSALAGTLLAHEFADNVGGEVNMGAGMAIAGGLGTAFLSDGWQRASVGVMGVGLGQLATAYLTKRAEKKAAQEAERRSELERAVVEAALRASPPPAVTPPTMPAGGAPKPAARNAWPTDAYAAVDQAYADEAARNGWQVIAVPDDDPRNGYGELYEAPLYDVAA